jgi:hypothetical protein
MSNYCRTATYADCFELARNLRAEDLREVEGLGHPRFAIPLSLGFSETAVSFFAKDGSLAGVAGIVRQSDDVGAIWMLCTPVVQKYPVTFVREAVAWVNSIKGYKLLWNIVDQRNTIHLKLLKKLGFRAIKQLNLGPQFLPYLEIVKLCA